MWIKYIWENGAEDRSLQAHRGSYKTTAVEAVGSVWWMLFHPNDAIGLIRKTYTDAALVVRVITQMMQMTEAKEIFKKVHGKYPEFKVKREGFIEFNFKKRVTPEGNVNAYGLDAGLTGKHLDKIILDDFVTLKDRISKAEREKTKLLLQEVMTNIINIGNGCGYVGTPWHKDDGWSLCPTPIKFNVHDCKILTEEQIQDKMSKTTPSLFSANYLLEYKSDGGQLFEDVKYRRWKYNTHNVVAHLDASYDGDHTSALTIMSEQSDKTISAIGFSDSGNVNDWMKDIVDICKRFRVKKIYVEKNPDKGWVASSLKNKGLKVSAYNESLNKHIKIATFLYKKWGDIYYDEMTDLEYLDQIIDYRKGEEPDDAPDSAASLVRAEYAESRKNIDALYSV